MDALIQAGIQSGALWYASRGTGLVSLLLLTGVVLLGILGNRGRRLPGLPRFATTALHRNLSLMSVAFLAVHIVSVVVDPYVTIGWLDAVVPFGASYRPLWVGLGTVSIDLILALIITSLVRVRMGRRTWRAIHWLAYAAWPAALAHGIGAGTDMRSGWLLWVTVATAALVGGAGGWRLALAGGEAARSERVALLLNRPTSTTGRPYRARPAERLTTGPRP